MLLHSKIVALLVFQNQMLNSSVAKATYFLEGNLMHIGDMYSYAIVCHALAKAGKPLCFNRLESMAVRDGVYNFMFE